MIQLGKRTKITVAEFKEYISREFLGSPEVRTLLSQLRVQVQSLGRELKVHFPSYVLERISWEPQKPWRTMEQGEEPGSTEPVDGGLQTQAPECGLSVQWGGVGTEDGGACSKLGRAWAPYAIKVRGNQTQQKAESNLKSLAGQAKHSWDTLTPPPSQAAGLSSLLESSPAGSPSLLPAAGGPLLPACLPPLHPAGRKGQSPGSES